MDSTKMLKKLSLKIAYSQHYNNRGYYCPISYWRFSRVASFWPWSNLIWRMSHLQSSSCDILPMQSHFFLKVTRNYYFRLFFLATSSKLAGAIEQLQIINISQYATHDNLLANIQGLCAEREDWWDIVCDKGWGCRLSLHEQIFIIHRLSPV